MVATAIELVGVALVVAGVAWFSVPVALIVAGLLLVGIIESRGDS